MYARDTGSKPTFATERDGRVIAFITLQEHFAEAWEVHCIAVSAAQRNRGLGTELLEHAEDWLRSSGARFLQIKTIAATREDANYAETRAFYAARGYAPLEIFPTLWHPRNPALQLIKAL